MYDFGPGRAHPDPEQARLAAALEDVAPTVLETSRRLHADPEVAYEEHRSSTLVAQVLEDAGFALERGIAGLDTAFRAVAGSGSLVVSLCIEYDALPGIGHACGHNLIAGASLGAALALRAAVDELDVTLHVLGTPAEEHGGGKLAMIDAGVFAAVDLSLMTHADKDLGTYDPSGSTSQAVGRWRATYTGRASHAAANPSAGVNANDAVVIAQVAASLLRQQVPDGQRLALVPQMSGVTNIIPEQAVLDLECRARDLGAFGDLHARLVKCLEAGALATGCDLDITPRQPVLEPLRQDEDLAERWNAAMGVLGRPLQGSLGVQAASTDMGNVSQRVPSLHPFVGITGVDADLHTRDFERAADSEEGYRLMFDAALAMAWIIRDVATDPARRTAIQDRAARMRAETADVPSFG